MRGAVIGGGRERFPRAGAHANEGITYCLAAFPGPLQPYLFDAILLTPHFFAEIVVLAVVFTGDGLYADILLLKVFDYRLSKLGRKFCLVWPALE